MKHQGHARVGYADPDHPIDRGGQPSIRRQPARV